MLPIDRFIINAELPYYEFQKLVEEISNIFITGKDKHLLASLSEGIVKQLDLFILASRALRKQFNKTNLQELIDVDRHKFLIFFIKQNIYILDTLYKLRVIAESIKQSYSGQVFWGKLIIDRYILIFEQLAKTTDKWVQKIPKSSLILI